MRSVQSAPFAMAQRWIAGLGLAGLLISGCNPDEVQAPGERPTAAGLDAATAPTGGLIGEWKLDETGGTNANDSKNNFDATVFGGAAFVAGKLGNALNLNNGTAGTGGKYAQMPSNGTLDNVQEGNYTISAWFNPATIPPDAVQENRHWAIVAKASPHLGIFYDSRGKFLVRHYLTGAVGEQAQTVDSHPVGAWYHIAGTVNKADGKVRLYVNGVFRDDASYTPNTAADEYGTTPWQIGRTGTIWAANGKIDQVRIYNRELSAAEVADLHDETVGPPPNAGLPAGLWGVGKNDMGTLPSAGSHFKGGALPPTTGATHDTNIDSVLARANEHGLTLVLRLSGGPGLYTDQVGECRMYNAQKFQDNLDRFVGNQALSAALASRRAIVMAIDEPWIDSYCQSISPAEVNQMGAFIKNRWPGAIVAVRGSAQFMVGGWDGQPAVNWTKIDYGWSQYNHVAAVNESQTPAQFFAGQKDSLNNMANLGMIPGLNIWNGGDKTCWTQPGGSSGRIYGSEEDASIRGDFVSCSSLPNPANSIRWVTSPQLMRSTIDAAVLDPDAPIFLGWTHVGDDDTNVSWFVMHDLERRSDFKAAFEYWNTKGATRSSWNGWRTAK